MTNDNLILVRELSDNDLFREWSWEVTCALAALSKENLDQVPAPVMEMIFAAKDIHKEIADAVEKRDALSKYRRRQFLILAGELSDNDRVRECSWEITCALAALSQDILDQVASPVMEMIFETKYIHKEIADAAKIRAARIEYCGRQQKARRAVRMPALSKIAKNCATLDSPVLVDGKHK